MKVATLLLLTGALCLTTLAQARERWQGAGWYQVLEKTAPGRDSAKAIYSERPFATREACLRTLPFDFSEAGPDEHALESVFDFSCFELVAKPHWDRSR